MKYTTEVQKGDVISRSPHGERGLKSESTLPIRVQRIVAPRTGSVG